ncbi:GAF domain-containing protein [Gloeothece verrucosa]|uniref:Putative phytochrome sensor protein n=1 Tax=Gloeothece verrucosa (strain PCC 7822) TaxID=497965 RepID=E0UFW6_GLOV7|nr:GAF domain-containing protein [Gloeothece verrucosa]ADN14349.1 putative phytochrome sensor protein [Gloeothece verrucosa PCC 7822]
MSLLTREILEAGRIYRSTGAIATKLLRQEIYRAWERSHLQGANPRAMQAEKLSPLEVERLLEQQSDFIKVVRPYAQILSQAAGKEHHAVMLADPHAVLIDLLGDEQTVENESFPQPGSLLSEGVAGANGIGTSLAEENYSEIVSAEHFIEGFHDFTCQGIPLRNQKQEILGVLSISLQSPDASHRLKELLLCASAGIEAELILTNLQADLRSVLVSHPDDYEVLEKLRQDIVQAHYTARLRMDLSSRMVASNRIDYAKQLLQQAEQSIEIFRRRANFWRELASTEKDQLKSLSLTETIRNLVEVLSTEAAIRKVQVIAPPFEDIIKITVLEKSFFRKLLRYFLHAFETAGAGGVVKLEVKRKFYTSFAQVNFIIMRGSNSASLSPIFYTLTLPVEEK